jgi:hypothetical protein
MRLSDLINENLPLNKKKKKYKFLAKGSARKVYIIDDFKVLKKAFNQKGLEQNRQEIKTYLMLKNFSVLAKVYSYAKDYSYLVMELCLHSKKEDFEEKFNISWEEFKRCVKYIKQQIRPSKKIIAKPVSYDSLLDKEWFKELSELILTYQFASGDLKRLSSWGVNRNGKLVLIDYGLDMDIYQRFYKKKVIK